MNTILGSVIAARAELDQAELALDAAMRHALELGEIASDVAGAGGVSRATLYRRAELGRWFLVPE